MLAKLADALCFSSGGLVAVGKLALIATRVVSSSEHTIKVDKSHREAALGFLALLSADARDKSCAKRQLCGGRRTVTWWLTLGDTASNNTSVEVI